MSLPVRPAPTPVFTPPTGTGAPTPPPVFAHGNFPASSPASITESDQTVSPTPSHSKATTSSLNQSAARFASRAPMRLVTFGKPIEKADDASPSKIPSSPLAFEQRAERFSNFPVAEKNRILGKALSKLIEIATRPSKIIITSDVQAAMEQLKKENASQKTNRLAQIFEDDEILDMMCFASTRPNAFRKLWEDSDFSAWAGLVDANTSLDDVFQNSASMGASLRKWYAVKFDPASDAATVESADKMLSLGISSFVTLPLRQAIEKTDFSQFEQIKKLNDPSYGVSGNTEIENTLRKALPAYFAHLDVTAKGLLMQALLQLPKNASDEDAIFALVHACGPGMQKLFQLFGSRSASEKLRIRLDELKDNIAPFSTEDALKIIAEDLKRPIEDVFLAISETPIAAASVSQVYYALIKGPNGPRPVAVKVRRPDYVDRLRADFEVLRRAVKDDLSQEVLLKLEEAFLKEANFRHEAQGLRKGRAYQHMKAVPLIEEINPTERLLVMEWADDATIKRAFPHLNQQERLSLNTKFSHAVGEWINRALSGDGFFHGDPHTGNLTHLHFKSLDYGNYGALSPDQQYGFIKLATATFLNRPDWMLGALYSLNNESVKLSAQKETELREIIRREFAGNSPVLTKINIIIGESVRLGLPLPESLVEFLRGLLLFETGWNRLRESVQKSQLSLTEKISFRKNSPEATILLEIMKKMGRSTPQGLHDLSLHLGRVYLKMIRG